MQSTTVNHLAGLSTEALDYLSLLRDSLLGLTCRDDSWIVDPALGNLVRVPHRANLRALGKDWPTLGLTMIGKARMDNIAKLLSTAVADNVQGDFLEAGVWRGGASIYARAVLNVMRQYHRHVVLADSFDGLPASTWPQDKGMNWQQHRELAVPLSEVANNFYLFGLGPQGVEFIPGYYSESLPIAKRRPLCVLRLDCDMYQSTMEALTNLYDWVQTGGYIIIDDGHVPQCMQAVVDFRKARGIDTHAMAIDFTGIYWQKEADQ